MIVKERKIKKQKQWRERKEIDHKSTEKNKSDNMVLQKKILLTGYLKFLRVDQTQPQACLVDCLV